MKLSSDDPIGQEVVAQMDLTTDPCVDFYQYACGGWIANNPLPEDKPRWGRGFGELGDRNNEILREILDADTGRAGALYKACMDEPAIDAAGATPLAPYLAKIEALKVSDTEALFELVGELDASVGLGAFFDFGLSIDFEQPDLHISDLGQGGTGLPGPSFYLDEAKASRFLPAYEAHIARMLAFVDYGPEDAAAAAKRIVAFETELARLQKPPEQMRDPETVYHRWDRKGVEDRSKLPWAAYLAAVGAPELELINVSNPEFVEGLPAVIGAADAATIKDYLRFNLIRSTANLLSAEIVEANFQFAAALTGQQQLQPRWERCVGAVNSSVGDLLSQQFVERSFAGDSREIAVDMIERVEAAFEAGLPALAWMDDATREAAVGKIDKIENKIGYPEKWRSYEGLELSGAYFTDAVAARAWASAEQIAKVGQQVDEQEWRWPASIVNASYNPLQNVMNFPAGILQPPFFHRDHPKAMNFGAMGMVMGHELTHGFDDSGRKFDADGVMREWWAPEVADSFEVQTQCVVETYSALEVQPGVHVKGELTLGENIADFGGVKEAYIAYQAWVAEHGPEPELIDGLSNEQLFFVALAQSWCTVSTPEFDELLVSVDPHSPPKFRINVPASHFPGFWDAFSCSEGTPMHPEQVCSVW
ncbi:M13 family metallopeptidase [Enhygromyxa salina]|uniref:M13 family metallopeptidase n=1 Tax=Enhygromyxa salina TaxID=215803 RepID=UPI0015E6067E|nr:M13 family metallopeptidase [Enhygromyxa salina]